MPPIRRRSVFAALLSAGMLMVPSTAAPPHDGHASESGDAASPIESSSVVSDDKVTEVLDCPHWGFDGSEFADEEFPDTEFNVLEFQGGDQRKFVIEPEIAVPVVEPINLTQEKIQERYPDGKIHIERWVTLDELGNFVNHGPWKQLDRDGQVLKSGSWKHGQREGEWFQTLDSDQVSRLSTNVKGFEAPFTSTASFKNGQLDGSWIITDRSNKTVVSWDHADGQRTGVSLWFTNNGSKRLQIDYVDNQPSGAMLVWNGPDQEPPKDYQLVRGMELKTETKWYNKTKRQKEEQFTYLVPSTMRIAFQSWDVSYLQYAETTHAEPIRHGKYVRWHRNGVLAHQGHYEFGEPSGEAEWWHDNGQRQVVGKYVEGQPSGQWVWWHDNGMRKISGEYYAGTQVGVWRSWSEQGQLAAVEQKLEAEQVIAADQPVFNEQYSEFKEHVERISTLSRPVIR